ncbi:uncharacterized protein [Lolium perenne]|uniref:uncharacterized protein n=1 Tax=Lolium perenne TaxID=4522 RepID=UPI003A98EAE5
MEHLVHDPARRTRVYYLKPEGMEAAFKVTVTLRARMVEKWIWRVKRDILDAATTKCVGLDCVFTDPRKKKAGKEQRAAVLQLAVASETLMFQMIHADIKVPQVLKDFLEDGNIRFYGAAIDVYHDDITDDRRARLMYGFRLRKPFWLRPDGISGSCFSS